MGTTVLVLFLGLVGGVMGTSYQCVPATASSYCGAASPAKVCAAVGVSSVDLSDMDATKMDTAANATCPKDNAKFTKDIYCQSTYIPCVSGIECPQTKKLCYGLCTGGGAAGKYSFLGADKCQTDAATTYCDSQVSAGTVAGPTDINCVGMSYFVSLSTYSGMATSPFQPQACKGSFPISNKIMLDFNPDTRVAFMTAIVARFNKVWGYVNNTDTTKFARKKSVKLKRIQMKNGLVQIYIVVKEFCLLPLRAGQYDYSLKYNNDQYCDKVSVHPLTVFQNLTTTLQSKPKGIMIGGEFLVKWGDETTPKPKWPVGQCYTWMPEEQPKIPGWVWSITAVAAMCCLLSILILQHRYRNRATYVRLNDKLRSYV